jgi:hypothetical protein
MPEVGREFGQVTVDIDVLPRPAHQRLDGKAVAKIVSAGPMALVWSPQANLS